MVKEYRVVLTSSVNDLRLTTQAKLAFNPAKEFLTLVVENPTEDNLAQGDTAREVADKFFEKQNFSLFNHNKTLVLASFRSGELKFVPTKAALSNDCKFIFLKPMKTEGNRNDLNRLSFSPAISPKIVVCNKEGTFKGVALTNETLKSEEATWTVEFLDKTLRGRPQAIVDNDKVEKLSEMELTETKGDLHDEAIVLVRNQLLELAPVWLKKRGFEALSIAMLVVNAIDHIGKKRKLTGFEKKNIGIVLKNEVIDLVTKVANDQRSKKEIERGVLHTREKYEEILTGYEALLDVAVFVANSGKKIFKMIQWVGDKFFGKFWL